MTVDPAAGRSTKGNRRTGRLGRGQLLSQARRDGSCAGSASRSEFVQEARLGTVDVRLSVRADVDDQALSRLHALAFDMPYRITAWRAQLQEHSLTWITAHAADDGLVGFLNVAWDGGTHAFLLDTVVDPDHRHGGLGTALVQRAVIEAAAAGCTWLHVDFDEQLSGGST